MARARTVWRCAACGHAAPKWFGRCPDCGEFGTFIEEAAALAAPASSPLPPPATLTLAEVPADADSRFPTGVAEFDRVLGGGLVRGSLVLLGGEPGVGKSTLLLQAADALARGGSSVLYVCGEESPAQVKVRARRLGVHESIRLLPEVDVRRVEAAAVAERPDLLVVDSIQTASDPESPGVPGSVGQVRACAARLMRLAKDQGITTLLVGHVTKEGAIAGPRVLEHMVDTVLYFEGDADRALRLVRAVKNRFGPVAEVGVFEMGEAGLVPVDAPSAALLTHRAVPVPGAAVLAAAEGSRGLLVEVQALVTPTSLPVPRRLANGIDSGRLLQLLAVLERRAGVRFGDFDVHVSVAGGVRIGEPAVDLPLALALASARRDVPVPADVVAFGEVGLTGELRPSPRPGVRLGEAARLGFRRVLAPGPVPAVDGLTLLPASTIAEALDSLS